VDETITSSLVAHLGYGISGNGTATGVILNDDMFSDDQARVPTIESRGNTALQRRLGGKGFAQVGPASRRVIRSPWGGASELLGDWQMLAAETVADQNQILLRNNPGNVLQVWNLNSAWSWQSSSSNINPLSAAALGLETSFQVDANGDGVIG
jgi:hypothetical protein